MFSTIEMNCEIEWYDGGMSEGIRQERKNCISTSNHHRD